MSLNLDKSGWKRVALGDVIRHVTDRVDPETSGLERFLAGEHIPSNSLHITDWGVIGRDPIGPMFYKRFRPGHVLYVSRRSYLRKTAVPDFEGITGEKTFVLETRDPSVLLQEFLPFLLSADAFHAYAVANSRGSVNPYINWGDMANYQLDLPGLEEQKRLADLLWAMEIHRRSLVRVRIAVVRERLHAVDRHVHAALGVKQVPLAAVAEVRGGIQKGKVARGARVDRPYLRVANVQNGALNLDEVKTIEVSEEEAERYALRAGDVLMTEGGDIDKLGRGAVWREQVEDCLHQNHVFAVRVRRDIVSPDWISLHTESSHGRSYFRIAAKRTSNLASVNKSQVAYFPVGLTPLDEQRRSVSEIGCFNRAIASLKKEENAVVANSSALLRSICGGDV
ncbi:hypothetical protein [Micromonospora sp. WMMD998]|uniref:restriction endonuclease subunit S n=1 Tax=Micromonospora sp. WMMD998 TaxID=3016092 RepID=UPI00249C15B2|nr:hypothetical protein [Micromonospora sp. WMMD998]WFE38828.1 hypothetical protein O7619_10450 [Micromonospora sp. WMMD998]